MKIWVVIDDINADEDGRVLGVATSTESLDNLLDELQDMGWDIFEDLHTEECKADALCQ